MNKGRIPLIVQGAPTLMSNRGTLAFDETNEVLYFNALGTGVWDRGSPFPARLSLDDLLHSNMNQTIGAVLGRQIATPDRSDFGLYATHNSNADVQTRANDADGPYQQYGSTGTSSGINMSTSRDVHRVEYNAAFTAKVKLTTTTDIRFFAGITDQSLANMLASNNPAGSYTGVQFSTGRGDTNWQFVSKDGAVQQLQDSGIAANTNLFIVRLKYLEGVNDTGQVEILNASETQLATFTFDTGAADRLPAAATDMQFVVGVDRPAGAATPAVRIYSVFCSNRFQFNA